MKISKSISLVLCGLSMAATSCGVSGHNMDLIPESSRESTSLSSNQVHLSSALLNEGASSSFFAPRSENLVTYWALNTDGKDSVGGLSLNIQNASFESARVNNGVHLAPVLSENGAGDLEVVSTSFLQSGPLPDTSRLRENGSLTLSLWIKVLNLDSYYNQGPLLDSSLNGWGADGISILADLDSNTINVAYPSGSISFNVPGLVLNSWANLVFKVGSNFIDLYFNGALVEHKATLLNGITLKHPIHIGDGVNILIDEIAVWRDELSSPEINSIYTSPLPMIEPSLLIDADGDGLLGFDELLIGTDPSNPDTDGDLDSDGMEVSNGTDPLDPCSNYLWICFDPEPPEILGCTDNTKPNYNPDATVDDGSCEEISTGPIFGCTNGEAPNYDEKATDDDGSCIGIDNSGTILGCMNSEDPNYNSEATEDDGSCEEISTGPIFGCTNGEAPNYDEKATDDDGSCIGIDNSGIILGCMNSEDPNYNSEATEDDGSCDCSQPESDCDGDGLIFSVEELLGTDSTLSDSDDDGYNDGEEVAAGTDPLASDSFPGSGGTGGTSGNGPLLGAPLITATPTEHAPNINMYPMGFMCEGSLLDGDFQGCWVYSVEDENFPDGIPLTDQCVRPVDISIEGGSADVILDALGWPVAGSYLGVYPANHPMCGCEGGACGVNECDSNTTPEAALSTSPIDLVSSLLSMQNSDATLEESVFSPDQFDTAAPLASSAEIGTYPTELTYPDRRPDGFDFLDLPDTGAAKIDEYLLRRALWYYVDNKDDFDNHSVISIVDWGLHNSLHRYYAIDIGINSNQRGKVAQLRVAHGSGSDPGEDPSGWAKYFSRDSLTYKSTYGAIKTGARKAKADTSHENAMYLHGLEPSNSTIFNRRIIMHEGKNVGASTPYVSPEIVRQQGTIGRSLGCLAINQNYVKDLIDWTKGGSLIYTHFSKLRPWE